MLVQSFSLAYVVSFLNDLSAQLACTCAPKHEYQCKCRLGKSKIIAKLLDRYFQLCGEGSRPFLRPRCLLSSCRPWLSVLSEATRSRVARPSRQVPNVTEFKIGFNSRWIWKASVSYSRAA